MSNSSRTSWVSPAGGPAATPPQRRCPAAASKPAGATVKSASTATAPRQQRGELQVRPQGRDDRGQPAGVAMAEHPAGQHEQPDVGPARPRDREVPAYGEDGRQRRDPAVLGRTAGVAGHVGRTSLVIRSTVGPSRSASTGSTTPSAWPSTSTPPAAERIPRSPSTVSREPSSGIAQWTSVVAYGSIDHQHPDAEHPV